MLPNIFQDFITSGMLRHAQMGSIASRRLWALRRARYRRCSGCLHRADSGWRRAQGVEYPARANSLVWFPCWDWDKGRSVCFAAPPFCQCVIIGIQASSAIAWRDNPLTHLLQHAIISILYILYTQLSKQFFCDLCKLMRSVGQGKSSCSICMTFVTPKKCFFNWKRSLSFFK